MKLLVFLILLAAAFYIVPGIAENVGSPCGAVVERTLLMDFLKNGDSDMAPAELSMARAIGPAIARKAMEHRYPSIPPDVACAGLWWLSVINKSPVSPSDFR